MLQNCRKTRQLCFISIDETKMPADLTKWDPKLPKLKGLHHYKLLSIIINFCTLNPWKTGAKKAEKYNIMGT